MSTVMQINPFEFFVDTNGTALDAGYIWIGEVNKYSPSFPVVAYYDEAMTIPAAMPLRTSNGYIVRNGAPTFLYIDGNYSILVQNKSRRQVYFVPDFLMISSGKAVSLDDLNNYTDPGKGAWLVGWTRASLAESITTVHQMLDSQPVSVWEFASLITSKPIPGDPSTWDWKPAFVGALATGHDVIVPAGSYTVNSEVPITIARQTITGEGWPTITQQTNNLGIFVANGIADIRIEGLRLSGAAGATTTYGASQVRLENCARPNVSKNIFTAHSASAIFLRSCVGGIVSFNSFTASTGDEFSGDITMWNQCSSMKIYGNDCTSGADQGITLQTIIDGDTANDNLIHGNNVQGCKRYGIITYNSRESKTGEMRRTRITNNNIRNILGSTVNIITGTKTYGNGIYTLSAEDSVISGNTLHSTNLQTVSETLAPAAIGVNESSNGVISGNTIANCSWDGIRVSDVGQRGDGSGTGASFIPNGYIVVTGNAIANCVREGIFVKNKNSVKIQGNSVYRNGRNGILTSTDSGLYPTLNNISITGNTSRLNTLIGIALNRLVSPAVSENMITNNIGDGLFLDTIDAAVTGNTITANSDGIDLRSTGSGTILNGNSITANGDLGVRCAHAFVDNGNIVRGNVTGDYSGAFSIIRALTDGATPSIQYGKIFTLPGPTAATDFIDGSIGQIIYIRALAAVTIVNNSAGIRLAGNANFGMTAGDTLTLIKTTAATWDEVGRMDR